MSCFQHIMLKVATYKTSFLRYDKIFTVYITRRWWWKATQ